MSDSLQPHGLQHTRPPCPSPIPGACSDSRPSSWWRHPTIWSSVVPFTSCLQSFPVFKYRAAQMLCHISRVQPVSGLAIAVAVALPLGFNSANINWASLLCVLCRNTKIKQDLWFWGVYSPEALFLLWFFCLAFFYLFKIHNLHLIILFWAQLPFMPQSCHIHCNESTLSNTGLTQTSKTHFAPSQPLIPKAAGSVASLVSSFLVVSSSLLPWLLVSSYSIQLAFAVRLPPATWLAFPIIEANIYPFL